MLDEISRYNQQRWDELSESKIEYAVPWLDLTPQTAMAAVNPEGVPLDVGNRDVLCLAASGGQQSAAFGVLGARVTVVDLSQSQLEKDRQTAEHYGLKVRTVQGDMRDLSVLADDSFDVVWQAHSINFVPDAAQVIGEVARVLRPAGLYRLSFTNPYAHGVWEEWDGKAYRITRRYVDGEEVKYADPYWEFTAQDGQNKRVLGPKEFRHSLSTIINSMIDNGLCLLGLWEEISNEEDPEPGSWEHFTSCMPPWIYIWARAFPRDGSAK